MSFTCKTYIISKFERKRTRKSIFWRVFYRVFEKYYKYLYKNCPDKKYLAEIYWGQEGGFLHAKDQVNRSREDWFSRYSEFYTLVKEHIYDGINILEIGCSAGQWPIRLKLEKYD